MTRFADRVAFFLANAGFDSLEGVDEDVARWRTALDLAHAEWCLEGQIEQGTVVLQWEEDPDGPDFAHPDREAWERGEILCLDCSLWDGDDAQNLLAHLGAITVETHDDPYCRVVAALLAREAGLGAGRVYPDGGSEADVERLRFFFLHGGYAYDPKVETPIQGRVRAAQRLAAAEAALQARDDIEVSWEDEDLDVTEHLDAEAVEKVRSGELLWLCCALEDSGSGVLASLGGIAVASRHAPYCRVVEAELALEAGVLDASDDGDEPEDATRALLRDLAGWTDPKPDEITDAVVTERFLALGAFADRARALLGGE